MAEDIGPNRPLDEPRTLGDFGITQDRFNFIMAMVGKRLNAGRHTKAHIHFRAYPPAEFLSQPDLLKSQQIYEKLKDTVWWVNWYDGTFDQVRFIEFLAFIDQQI